MGADIYIRFVVHEVDPDSGRRQGLLQAVYELREQGKLTPYERARAREILAWFGQNLATPTSFNRSSRPHALEKAISWFKDGATEHIGLMRELAVIAESHGVMVEVIRTERPGYVTYEDEHQIVAEPFSETRA